MKKLITTIAPKEVTSEFITTVNTATALLKPYKVTLSDEQKLGSRGMAEGREGYVRIVSRVATQFPDSLGRADKPEDLVQLIDYSSNLKATEMALLQALETVQELNLATTMDVMKLTDKYVDSLQISRKDEGSLDLAMREVDEYNKRFGKRTSSDQSGTAPDSNS